jgi:hypothetical protein
MSWHGGLLQMISAASDNGPLDDFDLFGVRCRSTRRNALLPRRSLLPAALMQHELRHPLAADEFDLRVGCLQEKFALGLGEQRRFALARRLRHELAILERDDEIEARAEAVRAGVAL